MDRMNPLDASFLYLEDGTTHMHIASCAVFEGPVPAFAELVSLFVGKLPLVPRHRQRVRFVPWDLGRPMWVDDPHFNLEYHLRHSALPRLGTEEDLRRSRHRSSRGRSEHFMNIRSTVARGYQTCDPDGAGAWFDVCRCRRVRGGDVDDQRARSLLQAERGRVQELLDSAEATGRSDREAGAAHDGASDAAEVLAEQNADDALTANLRDRLAALDRAEARLDAGSFGRSIRSGEPIPDERLEADPAAELTVEEAEQPEDRPG